MWLIRLGSLTLTSGSRTVAKTTTGEDDEKSRSEGEMITADTSDAASSLDERGDEGDE
jgi:hypothetical protein